MGEKGLEVKGCINFVDNPACTDEAVRMELRWQKKRFSNFEGYEPNGAKGSRRGRRFGIIVSTTGRIYRSGTQNQRDPKFMSEWWLTGWSKIYCSLTMMIKSCAVDSKPGKSKCITNQALRAVKHGIYWEESAPGGWPTWEFETLKILAPLYDNKISNENLESRLEEDEWGGDSILPKSETVEQEVEKL